MLLGEQQQAVVQALERQAELEVAATEQAAAGAVQEQEGTEQHAAVQEQKQGDDFLV